MNPIAQRLRSLAARTALDGIAEEMRAIADELAPDQQAQEPVAWLNPEDVVVDVVLKQLGGFAPVTTHGVRVTHKPSCVSVVVDSERSQHRNRQLALEALRALIRPQGHPVPAPSPQPAESALEKYRRLGVDAEETGPIERLRTFCSFAMNGQDWLDVEPFFGALRESPQPAVPVVEAFAEGWRMAADWANRDDLLPDMDSPQYAKERDERLAELRPAVEPMTLPPVEGDVLPAIGSKVLIHLASSDSWAEHEVVGYYVWEAINDLAKPRHHRVFVRVRDADGILNARHICDVRGITAKAEGGAP